MQAQPHGRVRASLVDHLIAVHGHKSVALIIGGSSEPVPEPREHGWSDAFQAHDLPPGPIVRTSFSRHGGYEAAVRLLNWATRPSAIFTASDQLLHRRAQGNSRGGIAVSR